MKILVTSDIHGDSYWAAAIVDKFHEIAADKLLLLGDILYHGPRNALPEHYEPKKVIEILNSEKDNILAVRGNCDTEVDQMVLDFPIMSDYAYLVSENTVFYATHGHHFDPANPPISLPSGAVLLAGHTHVACDKLIGGLRYMNPGSPSIPKEGTAPSYIIIENGHAELLSF